MKCLVIKEGEVMDQKVAETFLTGAIFFSSEWLQGGRKRNLVARNQGLCNTSPQLERPTFAN